MGTRLSNLKSVALIFLELVAFKAQKFSGSHDPGLVLPIFEKFLRGHVRTVPGNMLAKFEVPSFNRVGAISI